MTESRRRNFDSAIAERAGVPLAFTIGGEDFEVPVPLPMEPILMMSAIADLEDAEGNVNVKDAVDALQTFRDFIAVMVTEGDGDRLKAALTRARPPFDVVLEIVQWLVSEGLGVPLDDASPSDSSPSPNGQSSTVDSAREASVSSMPTPPLG